MVTECYWKCWEYGGINLSKESHQIITIANEPKGTKWIVPGNINGCEDRKTCSTCNETETISHILIHCKERSTQLIWLLAKTLWPHRNIPWPEITLGTILGCSNITLWPERMRRNGQQRQQKMMHQGPTWLFQILLSESAYVIWVLRCERVIQEKLLTEGEIKARWYCTINDRLTIDKVTATKIIRTKRFTQLIEGMWEPALRKEMEIPANWIYLHEVLVGRTAWGAQPPGGYTSTCFESHTTPNLGVCINAFLPHTWTSVWLQHDMRGWSILPPLITYFWCPHWVPLIKRHQNTALSKKTWANQS